MTTFNLFRNFIVFSSEFKHNIQEKYDDNKITPTMMAVLNTIKSYCVCATSPAGFKVERNGSPHPERTSPITNNNSIRRQFDSLFIP